MRMRRFEQTQWASLPLAFLLLAHFGEAHAGPSETMARLLPPRRFAAQVTTPPVTIDYHNGPVITGSNGVVPIYIIWYGNFSDAVKAPVHDFLASFQGATDVMRWWNVTGGFKDAAGGAVPGSVQLAGESEDVGYSLGKNLKDADLHALVVTSLSTSPANPQAVYFVLTATDVVADDFCMNSCSSHSATSPSSATGGLQLPVAWVGNPKDQCPGTCAWPFVQPSYMPVNKDGPVLPPNGDVGADAVIIQMAYMLAGTTTNPYNNAFYQGDAAAPLEAGTACYGFGVGAYSGYPGELKKDAITGVSYNAEGVNGRKFLLPTLWDPSTRACTPLASLP